MKLRNYQRIQRVIFAKCPNSVEEMSNILFQCIKWDDVERVEHKGERGTSFWQTVQHNGLRIRVVEYSPGYLADHWCQKGHIVHCLEGSFINELEGGESNLMTKGMMYVVSDGMSSHRSSTEEGAKLLIVDGDFLANK